MVSLNFYTQFETNLMSDRKVVELFLQLKSAKSHGKNYIKVKPHLVRRLLRNYLLSIPITRVIRGECLKATLNGPECVQ